MGINSGIFWQEAEGAYCAASCQKRLADEKEKEEKASTLKKNKNKTCYGIYCDDKKSDSVSGNQQQAFKNFVKDRNFIAIQISKTCQLSGTCPSYKELAAMYDNSNRYLSGDFYINEQNGLWEREEPKIHNVFEYYRFMNMPWIVFVDPDDYTWDRSKQIVIESSLVYQDARDKFENQVRVEYVGLDMDGCKKAVIGWENNGEQILFEVLNHFYSKCKDRLDYNPRVEIFVNSTIFADCDQECFYYRDQIKNQLKVEQIITVEEWEEEHCNDDDENPYSDITNYERNKEECDRVRTSLDLDDKEDGEPDCYGIYCDREDEKEEDDGEKTSAQIHQDRLRELEDIEKCKKDQTWDEDKVKGDYRRNLYDCNDDDERDDYLEIRACLDSYHQGDDTDVDCDDEDEREEHLEQAVITPEEDECEIHKEKETDKEIIAILDCSEESDRKWYFELIEERKLEK